MVLSMRAAAKLSSERVEYTELNMYRTRNPLEYKDIAIMFSSLYLNDMQQYTPDQRPRRDFTTLAVKRGDFAVTGTIADIQYATRLQTGAEKLRDVIIINTNTNQSDVPEIIDELIERFAKFKEHDFRMALTQTPHHQVRVITVRDNAALVFTNIVNAKLLHQLGAVLPVIEGVDVPEEITTALLNGDGELFDKAFLKELGTAEKIYKDIQFNESLKELKLKLNAQKTQQLDRTIAYTKEELTDLMRELFSLQKNLKELQERRMGIELTAKDSGSEFTEYLKEYRRNIIDDLVSSRDSIGLKLVTPLLYYDKDLFTIYEESTTPNALSGLPKWIQNMLHDIFIEENYHFMIEQGVIFNYVDNHVTRWRAGNSSETSKGIVNPHIFYFDCWGDNQPLIREAMLKADYIPAFEQVVATVSGINFADSAVLRRFCELLQTQANTRVPYLIHAKTGERLTMKEWKEKHYETTEND